MFKTPSKLGKATSPEQLADRSGEVAEVTARLVLTQFEIISDTTGKGLPRSVIEASITGIVRGAYLQGYSDASAYIDALATKALDS